ncbi:unnamed protein product [Cyprideis torosa]|uniref:Uncharacterized protein n=1 Tax=Cyprideis torosa TaxID=163714 RepID=A0A7R8WQM6_9CRUS|nr:unnamed protein product [Cyprideis torosa]CAG0902843.1 unnamed protein product [Cyprideis torosa]
MKIAILFLFFAIMAVSWAQDQDTDSDLEGAEQRGGMVAHSVCRATAEPQVVDSLRMGAPGWERLPQSKL